MSEKIRVPDQYRFTSRFAPFVMREDDDTSIDDILYDDNWLGCHAVIQSYVDALDELEHFDEKLRLVREQLDAYMLENGIRCLRRLRELAPNIRGMDYQVLGPLVDELRERGDEDLVNVTLEAFRAAPLTVSLPSKAKDKIAAKAAVLQSLAAGSSGHEAEAASRKAAELAMKHEVTPKKDPWDLDLDLTRPHRRVVHPEDVLIQKLDGALKSFRLMEYAYLDLRDNGRTLLEKRIRAIEQLLRNPHGQLARKAPVVMRRH
jgi:hypothetical protein